jgi:hypothetical protein
MLECLGRRSSTVNDFCFECAKIKVMEVCSATTTAGVLDGPEMLLPSSGHVKMPSVCGTADRSEVDELIARLDELSARATTRQTVEPGIFVGTIKSLLDTCRAEDPRELPWCSMALSDRINPIVASEKCISTVMAAAILMRGNVDYQHCLLGLICATFLLTKVQPEYQLEHVGRLWLSHGVCDILNDLQDISCPAATRKLAWDIAYVLVNCILKPGDADMGFKLDVSNDNSLLWELGTIHMMMKLFNSFVVTFPAHFPFMPAKYYEDVQWPLTNTEMCHGKLSSLFSYSYDRSQDILAAAALLKDRAGNDGSEHSDTDSSLSDSEGKMGTDDERVQGADICLWKPSKKRQPWVGKFSFLSMFRLYQRLMAVESCTQSGPTYRDVAITIGLLRSTFLVMYSSKPSLLMRNKATAFDPPGHSASCECCNKKFSVMKSVLASNRKNSCMLCSASVCGSCSFDRYWNDERCCKYCRAAIDDIGFLQQDLPDDDMDEVRHFPCSGPSLFSDDCCL